MQPKENIVTIHGFIKIGRQEHIERLQQEGHIYCNTVEYFRRIESDDKLRKDNREGAASSIKVKDLKVWTNHDKKEIPLKFTKVRLHTHDNEILNSHLYCLYVIKPSHVTGQSFVDKENTKFGDKFLIITNPGEFLKRLQAALDNKYQYESGLVKYYDDELSHNNLTIFHKPDMFKYQSEFRFHIKDNYPSPIEFQIGSIADISIIMDSHLLTDLNLIPNDND